MTAARPFSPPGSESLPGVADDVVVACHERLEPIARHLLRIVLLLSAQLGVVHVRAVDGLFEAQSGNEPLAFISGEGSTTSDDKMFEECDELAEEEFIRSMPKSRGCAAPNASRRQHNYSPHA